MAGTDSASPMNTKVCRTNRETVLDMVMCSNCSGGGTRLHHFCAEVSFPVQRCPFEARYFSPTGSRPDAEQAPQQHQLTEVIGRVIEDQQDFPEIRLPVAVRDLAIEVPLRIEHQLLKRAPVAFEGGDAL